MAFHFSRIIFTCGKPMNLALFLVGLVVLMAGRRLYWLFVAAMGFWAGLVLAHEHLAEPAQQWAMLIAVLGGILGALLAVLFQKVAIGLAGAAAGGFAGWYLLQSFGAESMAWVGLVIGAVLGGIVVLRLFDWGLILISSLAGARMIVEGLREQTGNSPILFLVIVVVGVVVQGIQLSRSRAARTAAEARDESARGGS